ncbi:hypothetical protein HanIR_Chr08g0367701 [Helianthus annuus]|nr:hypothetical protein HanIR_Chr08g0367701 [Helianthus annuus]
MNDPYYYFCQDSFSPEPKWPFSQSPETKRPFLKRPILTQTHPNPKQNDPFFKATRSDRNPF